MKKVVCSNCGGVQFIRNEAELVLFQETWTATLTQDICPACTRGGKLRDEVERMLRAERRVYAERG